MDTDERSGWVMTAKTPAPARPESRAKAMVRLVGRSAHEGCSVCRLDSDLPHIEILPPPYPPVRDHEAAVLDDVERLVLCETCISTAGRVLGLFRDPSSDPEVQRLKAACAAAREREEAARLEERDLEERVQELLRELGRQ